MCGFENRSIKGESEGLGRGRERGRFRASQSVEIAEFVCLDKGACQGFLIGARGTRAWARGVIAWPEREANGGG